jgi:hypothetical protein
MRSVKTTAEQQAAIDALKKSSNSQADMNARGAALLAAEERARAKSTAAVADQTGALSKLLGQIDPTITAYERLDTLQSGLNDALKAGKIGAEDYAVFMAKIAAQRVGIGQAGQAMHTLSLNSSMARRELGRLAADVANGNWGRLEQTSLTLANYSGLMGKLFTATGAAAAGAAVGIGVLIAQGFKASSEQDTLNKSIIATGDAASVTSAQLVRMAGSLTNVSKGDAVKVIASLESSGRIAQDSLAKAAQAAVDMATITG